MAGVKLVAVLVAVNVALVVVGIVALELIFGNWLRPNRMHRLNLVRGRTIRYDARPLYGATSPVIYTRDEWGFRGRYDAPSAIDILTVGGSATDQRYIADGATWQDVIEREFAREGRRVVVVNAGVDGQSTHGHLKNFDWWFPFVPDLRVRYFLFYLGVNDVHASADSGFDRLVKPGARAWSERVAEDSALYHVVRTVRAAYGARVHRLGHGRDDIAARTWTTEPLLRDHAEVLRERLAGYRARLRVLAERARAHGARPIFVTQPRASYRVRRDGVVEGLARVSRVGGRGMNGVDMYHVMQLFGRATLDVCAEADGVCVDAANEVDWQPGDFYDAVHNTPQGVDRLGRFLHARLRTVFQDTGSRGHDDRKLDSAAGGM